MKRFTLLVALFLTLVGCTPASTPVANSGIEGHVFIGPACPVVQVGNPCPDKPFQATMSILDTHGKKILKFQTDANGYFHIPLAAGEYILHPESPAVMPHAPEQTFTVMAGEFLTLNVTYDSGIR
jgi:hypothetical protein